MAQEGERSFDSLQTSESLSEVTEEEAEEVEVDPVPAEPTEPVEPVEPIEPIVNEEIEILVSNQWVNVPENENPPPVILYLVSKQTGEQVKSASLANGETSYLFNGLDKHGGDGSLNEYEVKSDEAVGYETTIENYAVTHTYLQSETEDESVVEESEEESDGEEVDLDEPEEGQVAEEVEGSSMSIMPMAIPTPGHYTIDPNSIVVPTSIEDVSKNDHTRSSLVWANGDIVYAAIKSTHALEHMVLNGVTTMAMDQYNAKINIFVDGVEYEPDGLKGNTNGSHWTVFKFNLVDLNLDDSGAYTFFVKGIGGGHDVGGTLIFTIPKVDITGNKVWVGNGNKPAITLQLMAQVEDEAIQLKQSKVLDGSESPAWTHTWEKVREYDPYGRKYVYSVDEKTVPINYVKSLDGLTVTNTYNPTQLAIDVSKVWIGPGKESVTINLLADGHYTGTNLVLNEGTGWTGSFIDLNMYDDETGLEITYTVEEVEILGYSTTVSGSIEEGFVFTNTNDTKITVDVIKMWQGAKTDSVTINLLADEVDTTQTLVLNDDNDWAGSFLNLRKYDATTGEEIVYSVVEYDVPEGYEVSYSTGENGAFIVTNTEIVGSLTVLKINEAEEALAGAIFELRDAAGNLIGTETTDSSGEIYFGDLAWGDYQLIEIKAPDGYRKLVQPISITIGPGDSLHIEKPVVNTKIGWEIPKTGGIGTAGFYGFGALVMVLTLGFFLRKRKPTE